MTVRIKGATEHNLHGVDVEFGDGLTVVTGVSGSGKTSLVFDTLYHESRRRFLEVFSLGSTGLRLTPAKAESITGMGPAIAVGQNLLNRNPGSTLATASGLHPFLRLLYANYGERRCPQCGSDLVYLTEDEIANRLVNLSKQESLTISVPLITHVTGSHSTLLQLLEEQFGAAALRVDGHRWKSHSSLAPAMPHDIQVRLERWTGAVTVVKARAAIRKAMALGSPAIEASSKSSTWALSCAPTCIQCGYWFGKLVPLHFRTPCPHCGGKGCTECDATGLYPEAAVVRWQGLRLTDLLALSVSDFSALTQRAEWPASASRLQAEISRRLDALIQVGLGYLSLDRQSPTLSRGESQRVRIAVALTSRLEDMLHVLDEPTIGQHPADVARLLPALRQLAGPVVYVEHDRIAATEADHAIDIGPGAGNDGGRIVYAGSTAGLWRADTPTGRYFSLRQRVAVPAGRPEPTQFVTIRGAKLRNLRNIDVPIPLSRLTVITGVSGSGKSTLVEDVLVASLHARNPVGCLAIEGTHLRPVYVDQDPIGINPRSNPATYTKLADIIRDCFAATTGKPASCFSFNRPEGACPTCKGMGAVEVHMRYLPSTWIPCSDCGGQRFNEEVLSTRVAFDGVPLSIADFLELPVSTAMQLLLDQERLPVKQRQSAERILKALHDVGLGYLTLGQPSPTLSGGEAQRVKLAKYLGSRSLQEHLLILVEPSTGLHPQDVSGLLVVLDRLVRAGATIVVVEHNTDIIRAADWVVDLGPGAGAAGGQLIYVGPPGSLAMVKESLTGQALRDEAAIHPYRHRTTRSARPSSIAIRDANAHNLKHVSVDFPKAALTVVTGVSGSGKSSLVDDVLEAEAQRRFLETLSMYERQSTREGPEAPVEAVTGLGVAITVGPERHLYDRRATVGTATELSHHLAILLATIGERRCLGCGAAMQRGHVWNCPHCGATAPIAEARHFSSTNYAAACLKCHGVGTLQSPNPGKLIIHPDKPLCDGAMYSPGFFPKGYLCKPFNGGYDEVQAMAQRYEFDPATTPWNQMTSSAQHAFLYGDPEPMLITYRSRTGRVHSRTGKFHGFYGWVRDWDTGGTYTDTVTCPECNGSRLRPEYTAVTLHGYNVYALSQMPIDQYAGILDSVQSELHRTESTTGINPTSVISSSLKRLHFLDQVGLGYLHLHRSTLTLSAGEAQRIKLASLLGSGLTSLTVLLDEPSRGLHPVEVEALLAALRSLCDEGNTVIVVEHDPVLMQAADYLVDIGPGAGAAGGEIVAQGRPKDVLRSSTITAAWLRGDRKMAVRNPRRTPSGWLTIRGARANNLQGETVSLPLGMLAGICGVSGSGKSTLMIDTLGRALAPRKYTTSVAREPIDPGAHDAIEGAPERVLLVDQTRAGVVSPAAFLNLDQPLRALFAASEDAQALGLSEKQLGCRCSVCNGTGSVRLDMGFLPDFYSPCDTCHATGYMPEAWEVRWRGVALPEVFTFTIDQVYERFGDEPAIRQSLSAARDVGLGYLVLRQPGYSLSGGESQRLKLAHELYRDNLEPTLYILDEPTVGQHLEDVARLVNVLHRLVDHGHSVFVVEHHPHLLAACDWLVELGPGGGSKGGHVVAAGTPEVIAGGNTLIAPYLREILVHIA